MQSPFQRLSGKFNVFAKQFAGGRDVSLAAQLQDLMVLLVRALDSMREIQLQSGIAFAAVVHIANDSHRPRLIGSRIEDGMELPVQSSPRRDVVVAPKLADKSAQHAFCF